MRRPDWRRPLVADFAALAAGALLAAAFAPLGWFPLAVLSPAALFLLWSHGSAARSAWRGFLFGFGMFAAGVSWVFVSMHRFGHMPVPLAVFATLLFAAGLALYPALLGFLQARLRAPAGSDWRHALLVLPAFWVLFEWWRGWFLTGFPWLNLGYSQADSWLAGYAAWLGVYGVSLLVALSAALLASLVHARGRTALVRVAVLAAIWGGGWLADQVAWTQPAGASLRFALVQGNVPLEIKWKPSEREGIIARYRDLTAQALGVPLIVWPEAAVPAYWHQMQGLREKLAEAAREHGSTFVFGVVEGDPDTRAYYNSVAVVNTEARLYRKHHLVPFGEYVPLPFLFRWLIDAMQIPMSDFSRGPAVQAPLSAAGQRLGLSVCYEDAFGEELIRQLPAASVLVNVSEDAWFGDTAAPHQRLQMARLRALETGRPMLRAANTGPSAAIDHRGMVVARTGQFEPAVLKASVQPMQGETPYVRFGNVPALVLAVLLLAAGLLRRPAG